MIDKIADYYAEKLGKYDKASECYELALSINPKDSELYYDLGIMEICKENQEKQLVISKNKFIHTRILNFSSKI